MFLFALAITSTDFSFFLAIADFAMIVSSDVSDEDSDANVIEPVLLVNRVEQMD